MAEPKHVSTRRESLEIETTITETEAHDLPLFTAVISVFGIPVATGTNHDREASVAAVKESFVRKLAGR